MKKLSLVMSAVLLILGGRAQAMAPKGKEEIEAFGKVARRAQPPLRQWQQRAQQINQELMQQQQNNPREGQRIQRPQYQWRQRAQQINRELMQQQQNNNVRHVPYQPQMLQRRQ